MTRHHSTCECDLCVSDRLGDDTRAREYGSVQQVVTYSYDGYRSAWCAACEPSAPRPLGQVQHGAHQGICTGCWQRLTTPRLAELERQQRERAALPG